MALTDTAIKQAKPGDVDRTLTEEKGLYLLVTAAGSKLWRMKYRIDRKEKKLALGSYPDVGMEEARVRRNAARTTAEAGSDPATAKREARIARQFAAGKTFGAIAEEYITKLQAESKAAVIVANAHPADHFGDGRSHPPLQRQCNLLLKMPALFHGLRIPQG